MKIKRRVMFDENRSPEDKKEMDALVVRLIAMLLSKRNPAEAVTPASHRLPPAKFPRAAGQANGKTKPVTKQASK